MTDDAKQLQHEIITFIATAKAQAAEGKNVSLDGLDDKIRNLCEVILTLSPDEAQTYRDTLQGITAELETLRDDLQTQQRDVRDQLEALNLRHKAAKAYHAAPPAPGKPPKDEK